MSDPLLVACLSAYLAGSVFWVGLNMKSTLARASAKNLDRMGLAWTMIPMMILSGALWPLWMASGLLVKWWLVRRQEHEESR